MTLLHNATLQSKAVDVKIVGGLIADISPASPTSEGIDCTGLTLFPGLCNMHSHAPMTLFRGLGDDAPLSLWLNDYIWPAERELTDEKVYLGTLQACREMLSSGTTFFNDMYFHLPAMARAVEESGIKARLGLNVFADADELLLPQTESLLRSSSKNISFSIAPHSIYTVSPRGLVRSAEACLKYGIPMHIHMSETQKEVSDCLQTHGCRPWELLDKLGILSMLGSNIIAAHCLHLSPNEIELMGKYGVTAVHCPNSNLKLGSGHRFLMQELADAGIRVALGTDGSASSNNLDMVEVVKTASLLQKGWRMDPTAAPASSVLSAATLGATIEPGSPADLMLVRLNNPAYRSPEADVSTLVYATHGDSVALTLVSGEVVYRA